MTQMSPKKKFLWSKMAQTSIWLKDMSLNWIFTDLKQKMKTEEKIESYAMSQDIFKCFVLNALCSKAKQWRIVLTAILFETGAIPTPSKSRNPTVCG
jgi:hypothetical protein